MQEDFLKEFNDTVSNDALSIEELETLWPRVTRGINRVKEWNTQRALLFIAHDSSPEEALNAVIQEIKPSCVLYAGTDIKTKKDFQEKIKHFIDGSVPDGAAIELKRNRICFVVRNLDDIPEWFRVGMKSTLEQGKKPLCILATTKNEKDIDNSLGSFFSRYTKIGRPRESF